MSATGGGRRRTIFYGIRARLVFTYLLIITLTVGVIEAAAIWAVNEYYSGNILALLKTQSESAANFYKGYLSNTEIEKNTGKFLDNLEGMKAQIQVINLEGRVIADSLHATYGKILAYPEVELAIKGRQGSFHGKSESGEEILAVAVPLKSNSGIAGAARFTVSLAATRRVVSGLVLCFILTGIAIIMAVFFISLYLARTITAPVKKITELSREIARGDLSKRADISCNDEIGILSESINHMAEEIQKTDRLKNEFISSISHELKTPLTSIKGWAVTLDATEPEDFDIIKRGIYIINSETDRLTDMVEELLDFSRLQSGKFSLQPGQTDMNRLVREVYEQMKPRAERQKTAFSLKAGDEPVLMSVDERRIRQVLINLLDNSFKYTKPGREILLAAGLTDSSGSGARTGAGHDKSLPVYEITVEDNGCGIDSEELPFIKNRFYRSSNSENKSGLGLGLSICDELVNAHGGSMDIFSGAGNGTRVIVRLPVR